MASSARTPAAPQARHGKSPSLGHNQRAARPARNASAQTAQVKIFRNGQQVGTQNVTLSASKAAHSHKNTALAQAQGLKRPNGKHAGAAKHGSTPFAGRNGHDHGHDHHGHNEFARGGKQKRAAASRFSERREGHFSESAAERKVRSGQSRRKEIVAERAPNKPGFTTFQLRLVSSILHTTIVEKKPLDKAYAQWFSKVKIPAIEQGFIIRHINAMFRRLSLFAQIAGLKRPSDFERHVNRLILAYYTLEKWPWPELDPDGMERSGLDKKVEAALEHPLLKEGCPYWLEELGSRELKEAWPAERQALGLPAPRFIRVNTLKATRDELAQKLSAEGVVTRPVKGVNTALEVTSNAALFRTAAFREGLFEQQDAGSQEIAPFVQAEPGMRVIDACAGSGGKTLHLAALMQGKGTLIALDIEGWKLEDLKKRAKRAGAFNIDTRLIDSTKVIKRLHEHADRVLIDAPCSGLGVLRRNPDGKWSDPQARLATLKQTQAELLERYALMAKVGGKVVYSTCSILPAENQLQVQAFLSQHGAQFQLEEEKTILPSSGFDGFYMARLVRIA